MSFVAFPFKSLGGGEDAECTWKTGYIQYFNTTDIISTNKTDEYDSIQAAAYKEGMCIPNNATLASKLHIFSQAEAIECLSPTIQQRHISVIISGDSYTPIIHWAGRCVTWKAKQARDYWTKATVGYIGKI